MVICAVRATKIVTSNHDVELDDGRRFALRLEWAQLDGTVRCVAMHVVGNAGAFLDSATVRLLQLGGHMEEGRLRAAREFTYAREVAVSDRSDTDDLVPIMRGAERYRARLSDPLSGAVLDDEHYRWVAKDYAVLLRLTNKPTSMLAQQYGVSVPTAARWVKAARDREFLPKTTPGRATASWPDDDNE